MKIYPAIDIINGKCVRLTQGKFDQVKEYPANPLAIAEKFINQGSTSLHLIDLEGAIQGKPVNNKTILKIASTFNVDIQVGGGIRTFNDAVNYLENGISRIILSTAALTNSELIKKILRAYGPDCLTISLDIKDGEIALKGWSELSKKVLPKFLNELKGLKISNLIITDIGKDGTLQGPNLELVQSINNDDFKITAAGGVTNISDIKNLKNLGIDGAIIGKALYEETLNLSQALQLAGSNLTKRIIPCLDIENNRVVKGTYFKNLRDAGDPVELARYYAENGADELVFLDITATGQKRKTLTKLTAKIAKNISIPFTIGGGISSIEDIRELLNSGADKVSIGSAAVTNSKLIQESSLRFGSQCIVISLDCSKTDQGWELYIKGGSEETGIDVREFAKKMELLGAGELLINSLDRDGTAKGYDLGLLKSISQVTNLPIIASSGAGTMRDFLKAFTEGKADAALAASLFHYGELEIPELKKYLSSKNIPIRT